MPTMVLFQLEEISQRKKLESKIFNFIFSALLYVLLITLLLDMLAFKSKTAKVPHKRTPIIIITVKNQPSPQVIIKEYKHPKATPSE